MNKLKEQMNAEIKRAVNKYNSAVFILNGGSFTKAIELYDFIMTSGEASYLFLKENQDNNYQKFKKSMIGAECVFLCPSDPAMHKRRGEIVDDLDEGALVVIELYEPYLCDLCRDDHYTLAAPPHMIELASEFLLV